MSATQGDAGNHDASSSGAPGVGAHDLLQSAHLINLGELSAHNAHELNDRVQVVLHSLEQALERVGPGPAREPVEEARLQAQLMGELLRTQLLVARQPGSPIARISVRQAIERALRLLERPLRADGVQVRVEVPPEVPDVGCGIAELEQMLLALLSNGLDVLNRKHPGRHPDKELSLRADALVEGAPRDAESDETPPPLRRLVRITVTERGAGLPADVVPRVDEPVASPEPSASSSGLGIRISQRLAAARGGELRFESREGAFTRAVLTLPAARSTWEQWL